MEKVIPLGDRQLAMSLLLELALQRGTLSHLLDAILLLLRLSDLPPFGADKNRRLQKEEGKEACLSEGRGQGWEENETSFPLVTFLRRLGGVETAPCPFSKVVGVQEVRGICTYIFSHSDPLLIPPPFCPM